MDKDSKMTINLVIRQGQKPLRRLVGREGKKVKTENANSIFKTLGWKEEGGKGNSEGDIRVRWEKYSLVLLTRKNHKKEKLKE